MTNNAFDYTYLDEEKLINSDFQTESQKKVYEEMHKFDLKEFLKGKGASSGATAIITKNQMIIVDAFEIDPHTKDFGTHLETAKTIYKAIYGNKPYIVNSQIKPSDIWQKLITNDGNILIQLCDPKYFQSTLWLPEILSNKQINFLENIASQIEALKEDFEFFQKNPVVFNCMYSNQSYNINSENLTELLEENFIKNRQKGGIK